MLGFGVIIFIAFFSYALLGMVLFCQDVSSLVNFNFCQLSVYHCCKLKFFFQIADFSDMVNSIFTLLRIILGDFDFEGMAKSQPILGPTYFVSYALAIFFILLVSRNWSKFSSHFVKVRIRIQHYWLCTGNWHQPSR